jgi:hypothetical protein
MKIKTPIKKYQRIPALALLLCCSVFATPLQSVADEAADDSVGNTRAALEKWVETRRIISKEKQDFELGLEMLNERIALIENEIGSLQEKIKETEGSISEADKKRVELVDGNEKFKTASASLVAIVMALEKRTTSLLAQLPKPIIDRVKPLSQRFPEDGKETKLSLGERFQNVVGVLNEINKFNREVTVTSEVLNLPDHSSVEVTALYVGIGQGYYANTNGDVAGTGRATQEGWVWTPANESASQITQAIAILKNEAMASFVELPIKIQ